MPLHTYMAFDVPFSLSSNEEELFASMLDALPYGSERTHGQPPAGTLFSLDRGQEGYTFAIDAAPCATDMCERPLMSSLRTALMVHVADHASEYVFLHAGVVAVEGVALVLPGKSFAGKSTLVAALVQAGALYYSDEYAVIDVHGRVHPYARDLQMRRPGSREQGGVPVTDLGGLAGHTPLPAGQVLFVEYRPGSAWRPQPLSAGTAVLEMLRHSIPVQRTPARVMQYLSTLMQTAVALRSQRGEAEETAAAILNGMLVPS